MKKLIGLLLIMFYCFTAIGQSVIQRTPGTNTVNDPRLMASLNLFIPRYSDTTQANLSKGIDSCGAEIFTYTGNIVWIRGCSPKRWVAIGTGTPSSTGDTLFAELPAFFDSTTRAPNTILKILRGNGIVSGGTVTVDSCNTLFILPTIISLNYTQYSSAATTLNVPANGSAFPRVDEVIDSLGTIVLRIGTPSSTPVGMGYNSATEVILASYEIQGMASCVDITRIIVWDENLGTPNEFTLSLAGTISANGDNTDAPFHLLKAIFVVTYNNGSLIFTSSSPLTASAGELLSFWIRLNGAFGSNQIQLQIFNGSTSVGNPLAFGAGYGFNPNDSNQYQQVVPPLSAMNIINQTFDKIVMTFNGSDLSGAKGLYIDYVTLQSGASNANTQLILTHTGSNCSLSTYDPITGILNIPPCSGGSGTGDSTLQQVFDGSQRAGDAPKINGHNNQLGIDSLSEFNVNTNEPSSEDNGTIDIIPRTVNIAAQHFISSTTQASSSLNIQDSTFTLDAYHNSLSDNAFRHQIIVNPTYVQIRRQDVASSVPLDLPANFFMKVDSSTADPNSVVWVAPDNSWHKGHITSGGGGTLLNIGSGFRLAVPNTNNIKTLFNGYAIGIDSASNSNALTLKADTSLLLTKLGAAAIYQTALSFTSPLVNTAGTIACATCVVATVNPGVGVAHFAGSTQTTTSSLIVNADITNSTIDLTTKVTGVLPIANGGTNNGSLSVTNQNILITDGTKVSALAKGANGTHLIVNGSGNLAFVDSSAGGTTPPLLTVSRIGNTIDSLNLLPQTNATPNPPTGNVLFDSSGINYRASNGLTINLTKVSLTANRRDSFPDESGTFMMRKDSTIFTSKTGGDSAYVANSAPNDSTLVFLKHNRGLTPDTVHFTSPGSTGWTLTGNLGLNTPDSSRFLGTTNATSLLIKTNNLVTARFDSARHFVVGSNLGTANWEFQDSVGTLSSANNVTEGMKLQNVSAASAGTTAQYSPALIFGGAGWKSNATAASQTNYGKFYFLTAGGAATTDGTLIYTAAVSGSSTFSSGNALIKFGSTGGFTANTISAVGTGGTAFLDAVSNPRILSGTAKLTLQSNITSGGAFNILGTKSDIINIQAGNQVAVGGTVPTATFEINQSSGNTFGTAGNTVSGTTVTGVSTDFLNRYRPGDQITLNTGTPETQTITAIASNTSMTTTAWTNAHTTSTISNVAGSSIGVRFAVYGNGEVKIGGGTADSSSVLDVASTLHGVLLPRMTNTQMAAVGTPATGLILYNTDAKSLYSYNGTGYKSPGVVSGSFSQVGTATTVFTVTFGGTQPNTTYKVNVTPTAALSAALFYVTNKTATTFDVTYLAGLTGTVTFDYLVSQ